MTTLPTRALSRLNAIKGAAADAHDAAASAQRRIDDIRKALSLEPSDMDALHLELQRLETVRARQNERMGVLSSLVASINMFLTKNKYATFDNDMRNHSVPLKKDETHLIVLGRVRDEINAIKEHIGLIKSAPMPVKDLKEAAREQIQHMAERGRPHVRTEHGQFKMTFSNPADTGFGSARVMELMAFLFEDKLVQLIDKEIDKLPFSDASMPALQKAKRILELEGQLDKLERREQDLLDQLQSDGVEVLQRDNASACAVLRIVQVKQKAKAVA